MRVFITGGAGFIGSHLADALIARGDHVTILDNLSTGSAANIAHIKDQLEIHQGDIRDQGLVESLVEKSDLVLHMAAALGVSTILEKTIESVSVNFTGSEVVLNAATKFKKRIIIASTSEIYGKNPQQPLHEESDRVVGAPQKIRWTYSDAKALEEAIAHSLHTTQGLKVTTVRLFNTVGPRQTGRYGMVLPRFVQAALKNEPITIYGDGNQTRCFAHVYDVVDAVVSIAFVENTIGKVINIGNDYEISINDLAQKIIKETNSKSEKIYVPYVEAYGDGFEDMERRVPNINLINELVGWKPKRDLSTMIADISVEMNKSF